MTSLELSRLGRSHLVQRTIESATPSSADVQQSVFASVDSVAAFSAAAAREQQQNRQQMPRLAELQVSAAASAGKTSAASKKKLMSMAFQAQKQRREAAVAAAATAAAMAETGSNADTVSSSDNDTSPARELENTASQVPGDQSSVDGKQPEADGVCMTEEHVPVSQLESASFTSVTDDDCEPPPPPRDSFAADSTDAALTARPAGAVAAPPKTLTPAKTLPASLVMTTTDSDDRRHSIDVLSSPIKLLPPADPQHIHAIVGADVASATSDLETIQPGTECTEEQ